MSKNAAVPLSALNQDNNEATERLADEQTAQDNDLPETFGKPHADAEDTSIEAVAENAEAVQAEAKADAKQDAKTDDVDDSEQRVPLARVREITRQKHEAQEATRAERAENERLRAELDALRKPDQNRDFDAEMLALKEKFDGDSDMTHDEFTQQLTAISIDRGRAEQAAASYADNQKRASEALNRSWDAAQAAFLEVNPIYATNKAHVASLNAYIHEVAAEDSTLTPDEILDEAHIRVGKDLGATKPTQKELTEAARRATTAAAVAATATLPAMPQGGMGSRSTGNEIDMDAMTPEKWGKMSKTERDKALGIAASV